MDNNKYYEQLESKVLALEERVRHLETRIAIYECKQAAIEDCETDITNKFCNLFERLGFNGKD